MQKLILFSTLVVVTMWMWAGSASAKPPFSVPSQGGGIQACVAQQVSPVPQTGQMTCWDTNGDFINCAGTMQDGDLQAGVWLPSPRFTDNLDGTITDNLTRLIWLKDADCFGTRTWAQALTDADTLNSGECGLSDGSLEGDWYLPNVRELLSLINFEFTGPALSDAAGTAQWDEGDAFTDVRTTPAYWSSTTFVITSDKAWGVGFGHGNLLGHNKSAKRSVIPVRDKL